MHRNTEGGNRSHPERDLNHANSTERSTERVVEDGVMFVRARRALQAGTELTTAYFVDHGDPATKPAKWDF